LPLITCNGKTYTPCSWCAQLLEITEGRGEIECPNCGNINYYNAALAGPQNTENWEAQMAARTTWTKEEDKILREVYPVDGARAAFGEIGKTHTLYAVRARVRKLGVKRDNYRPAPAAPAPPPARQPAHGPVNLNDYLRQAQESRPHVLQVIARVAVSVEGLSAAEISGLAVPVLTAIAVEKESKVGSLQS